MKNKTLCIFIGIMIGIIIITAAFGLFCKSRNGANIGGMPSGDMRQPPEMPNGNGNGAPPDKPDGNGGGPMGAQNIEYNAITTLSSDTNLTDETYISSNKDENAVLAENKANVTMESVTVEKTGDSDGGDATSFYVDEVSDYSNIDFNGYKLYVNGTAIN